MESSVEDVRSPQELSHGRAAGLQRDSPTESCWVVVQNGAKRRQWVAPNPCVSSRLSASTSMDTTWWPGIMARPRTLGSPWENVSEGRKKKSIIKGCESIIILVDLSCCCFLKIVEKICTKSVRDIWV